jgi:hypothetical protein
VTPNGMRYAGLDRGGSEFTAALPHDTVANPKVPTVCLILARTNSFFEDEDKAPNCAYLGLVCSRPKASGYLLERLASVGANFGAMQILASILKTPRHFREMGRCRTML